MSALTVAAVLARIAGGGPSTGVRAHDGDPDVPTYPYCVVYADASVGVVERESDSLSVRVLSWQTTVVGVSAAQCRAAVDRVVAALEGWRPSSSEPSCGRVQHASSQPVRPDETVSDRTLFIATDQWRVAR